jgi:hypothetical protein
MMIQIMVMDGDDDDWLFMAVIFTRCVILWWHHSIRDSTGSIYWAVII